VKNNLLVQKNRKYLYNRMVLIKVTAMKRYNKLIIIPVMLFFPFMGVAAKSYSKAAAKLTKAARADGIETVAVMPFEYTSQKDQEPGVMVSEELSIELVRKKGIRVIERSQLDKIASELQLSQSGLINQKTAQKVGAGVGAEALIIGTMSDLNREEAKVTIKLVKTETFEVLWVEQVIVQKTWVDSDVSKMVADRRKKAQDIARWAGLEFGFFTTIGLPSPSGFTMHTSYDNLTETISRDVNGIKYKMDFEVGAKWMQWFGKFFGWGLDLSYMSFSFKGPQEIATNAALDQGLFSTTLQSTYTLALADNDEYSIKAYRMGLRYAFRIPIGKIFYPYGGLSWQYSFVDMTYKGSGQDPIGYKLPLINFGINLGMGGEGSIFASLRSMIKVFAGVRVNILNRVGLFAEYSSFTINMFDHVNFYDGNDMAGKTIVDPAFGTLVVDPFSSVTGRLAIRNLDVHVIRFGIDFFTSY